MSRSLIVQDGILVDSSKKGTKSSIEKLPSDLFSQSQDEFEQPEAPRSLSTKFGSPFCTRSLYGKPSSSEQVRKEMGLGEEKWDENGGLIWEVQIIPNDFDVDYKTKGTLKMLPLNNYDPKTRSVKPRRGSIAVTSKDFFSSLVQVHSEEQDTDDDSYQIYPAKCKWVFSGVMNGWPALRNLEVLKIQTKGALPRWNTHWSAKQNFGTVPTYPKDASDVRAKLRAPSWSGFGWSKDSLGFIFWHEGLRAQPRLTYGTNIIKTFENERYEHTKKNKLKSPIPSPNCVKVHMISHRYSCGDNESMKDKFTYHSIALLEWDHGEHCTVVESAWLGGLGGAGGKSNWIEDKEVKENSMFKCFPPELVMPWKNTLSELRCTDVPAKNLDEHLAFMSSHTDKNKRFLDVNVTFSHAVRLTFCSKEQIAQYLINYIRRGRTYSEIRANCQTFVADFCSLLAGKKDVQPFHPLNRIEYRNQKHHFLYQSDMYSTKSV